MSDTKEQKLSINCAIAAIAAAEGKHTPGPWRVEEGTTLIWGACDPDDRTSYGMGYPVAEVRVLLGNKRPLLADACHEESKANAYLTAAAPEMLDALSDARRAIASLDEYALGGVVVERTDGSGADYQYPIRDELLAKIDAAIAKAEGRSDG